MQIPSAPLAIAFPLIAAATVFALAYRAVRVHATLSVAEVLLVSMAASISALVVAMACYFGFSWPAPGALSPWLFAAPLVVYSLVLYMLSRRFRLSVKATLIGGALTLVPLYFLGGYAGILVACSFGECI